MINESQLTMSKGVLAMIPNGNGFRILEPADNRLTFFVFCLLTSKKMHVICGEGLKALWYTYVRGRWPIFFKTRFKTFLEQTLKKIFWNFFKDFGRALCKNFSPQKFFVRIRIFLKNFSKNCFEIVFEKIFQTGLLKFGTKHFCAWE